MTPPRRPPGRRPPAVPLSNQQREVETERRRSRAHEELFDIRTVPRAPFFLLEVGNPLRGTRYRVYFPAYPLTEPSACDCTDYARRAVGTCKHLEAARLWLEEHPKGIPPGPPSRGPWSAALWREIDARQLLRLRDAHAPSLRWRRPGAVLYENRVPAF
jgi:hypothetical protein